MGPGGGITSLEEHRRGVVVVARGPAREPLQAPLGTGPRGAGRGSRAGPRALKSCLPGRVVPLLLATLLLTAK